MNIKIIGTSHIAKQSVNEIETAIKEDKPDIVAVELDIDRAHALLHEQKNKVTLSQIFQIGIKGFLFVKIGQFVQQKLGKMVGMAPGSDMKAALLSAKKNKLKIALIDQPIKITLKNFSKSLTWREKWRFFIDILKGIFQPKKQIEELGLKNFNLSSVPKDNVIEKMVEKLEDRYPSIYKTLVSDRNRYMVRKLVKLSKDNPDKKILAVVGAGHKKGMEELFNKFDVI